MRLSQLFLKTFRQTPAEADIASHRLMLRAGMIHQIAAGIFDYLPLGLRVKHKVEAIMREEMDALGGQEVSLPMVQPASLWQRSGRWYEIGSEMARLRDAGGRDMCLGMTHEEPMAEAAAFVIDSYRQLPVLLYQIQTKFRDEPRPRAGLIRVREFTMKDAYSFHANGAGLDRFYPDIYQAYFRVFERCGLKVVAVESDVGMMGGSMAHEFMALTPVGEDTLLLCDACGYRANRQVAVFRKPQPPVEAPLPRSSLHTPGASTIEDLARFLGIDGARTAKAVFMVATLAEPEAEGGRRDRLVFAVLRGDMELNETKLTNAIAALQLRPAHPEEVRAIGAEPGFGSPIGIDRGAALVVVDDLAAASPNLVAGANRPDYHFGNVNVGRDFEPDLVTDIAAAAEGYACASCGAPLRAVRGVEVGNIFKLGTKYSLAMNAQYLDEQGQSQPIVMGSYGIGTGRLMACVIEAHHDDSGIVWPISIAPYQVGLISLANERSPGLAEAADGFYEVLRDAGFELLYDDRDERPGVKFNDADLLGIPIRLTVGSRGLEAGLVELRHRRDGTTRELPVDDLVAGVRAAVAAEWAWLDALREDHPFDG